MRLYVKCFTSWCYSYPKTILYPRCRSGGGQRFFVETGRVFRRLRRRLRGSQRHLHQANSAGRQSGHLVSAILQQSQRRPTFLAVDDRLRRGSGLDGV